MQKTIKSCHVCKRLFVLKNHVLNHELCSYCHIAKQKQIEKKLIKYMANKYLVRK